MISLLDYVLFIAGLFLLVKGAGWFVSGASLMAKRLGVSPFFIGLTVVAFGTSAPEFVINVVSAFHGNTDIALGNIIGSNISNTLLILGLAAAINLVVVTRVTVFKEIPLNLFAIVLLTVMSVDSLFGRAFSQIDRGDGLVLLVCFGTFLAYSIGIRKRDVEKNETIVENSRSNAKIAAMVVGGISVLILGGNWVVEGAVVIARAMGISEAIIGLTIIAIGTSLPELMTSVVATLKKNSDIAVGNIIGSNIFNIFFILGVTSLISPLPVSEKLRNDMFVAVVAAILLMVAVFTGKKYTLDRKSGFLFLALYVAYLLFILMGA